MSHQLPSAILDDKKRTLTITSKWNNNSRVLCMELGQHLVQKEAVVKENSGDTLQLEWAGEATLQIKHSEEDGAQRYDVEWVALDDSFTPQDNVAVQDSHWYGGPSTLKPHWPSQKQNIPMEQYLPKDILDGSLVGGILERYWLSSKGAAIMVDNEIPLHFSSNESQLCFKASYKDSWYNKDESPTRLKYTICIKEDIKAVHMHMLGRYIDKPEAVPGMRMFGSPVWSTWAQYKMDISQDIVLDFAKKIKEYQLPGGQIEIDDKYTTAYGDFEFDHEKFPDPKAMIQEIHEMGLKVSSWVTCFVAPEAKAYKEGMEKDYFIKDSSGKPGLIKWWQGEAAVVDFTNPEATKWFVTRLETLTQLGIDTFKFDAGEVHYLPPNFKTFEKLANPNEYATRYAQAMYEATNNMIELRVGYKTQRLPIWVRMMDKLSSWDQMGGYQSLIPTILHQGIIGYPFCLPDMIGGNAYNIEERTFIGDMPEKELYIRWTQMNIFFPAMQFSVVPWQYDEETMDIVRRSINVHIMYVPKLVFLARESTATGAPIIRPMWWAAPKDPNAYEIEDQFMVGDEVLVAPIMKAGERSRSVYIPPGKWQDILHGHVYEGPMHVHDLSVKLDEILFFEKQDE